MRTYRLHIPVLCIAVLLIAVCSTSAVFAQQVATPNQPAQAKALATISTVFGEDIKAARTDFLRIALAEKMIETANETGESNERYVLLDQAHKLATKAGRIDVALQSITALASTFKIDEVRLKCETAIDLAPRLREGPHLDLLASVAHDAVDAERYDLALRVTNSGLSTLRRIRDRNRLPIMLEQKRSIQKADASWKAAVKAEAVLIANPNDANASMIRGRYLCLYRDDWSEGLSALLKSADPDLGKIVAMEFKRKKTPDDIVALGDSWWAWVEKDKDTRLDFLASSRFWYERAQPVLSGLHRKRVEDRLKELDDLPFTRSRIALPNNQVAAVMVAPSFTPEELAESAIRSGGSIVVLHGKNMMSVRKLDQLPPAKSFVVKHVLFGSDTPVDDVMLARLKGFPKLTWISIRNSMITGEGFKALKGLPITDLWLKNPSKVNVRPHLNDTAFSAILDDFPLKHLYIESAGNMSDQTFEKLINKPLTELRLWGLSTMSTQIIEKLATMTQLTSLQLGDIDISDVDVSALKNLKDLKQLGFNKTLMTTNNVKQIGSFTQIEKLGIMYNSLKDSDIEFLVTLTNMTELNLGGSRLGDGCLRFFARMKQLELLQVVATKMSDRGLSELRKQLPKCKIRG